MMFWMTISIKKKKKIVKKQYFKNYIPKRHLKAENKSPIYPTYKEEKKKNSQNKR